MACEEHFWGALFCGTVCGKAVAESFDHGFCSEIRAADADGYHCITVAAERFGCGHDVVKKCVGGFRREIDPAEEVAAGPGSVENFVERACGIRIELIDLVLAHCAEDVFDVNM